MMMNRFEFGKHISVLPCLLLGVFLFMPYPVLATDLSGTHSSKTEQDKGQLSQGHRYIQGTVEEVNENTIRVNAGEAGDMSPRYLNLQKSQTTEEINLGDKLKIEVNAQNQVVKFQKLHKKESSGKSKM